MPTPASKILSDLLQYNHEILHMHVKDITQAQSLLQLPFRGNCLNWVVGHILGVYGELLDAMELPGTLSLDEAKVYEYGSEPLTDPARASDLDSMVKRMDTALAQIIDKLESLSPAELEREIRIWRGPVPLIEGLFYMQWHASFHTGQLEQLRQLAGKNDKVI